MVLMINFNTSDMMKNVSEIGLISYAGYFACICILSVYLIFLYVGVEANHFDFIEQDPELSLPLLTEQFSCNAVTIISVCMPVVSIMLVIMRPFNKRHQVTLSTLRYGLWMYLGLGLAMLSTYCLTNTIKLAVGMPRPNCFAMCNYQGYNDAIASNDFTVYNDLTTAGVFGNQANCLSSNSVYRSEAFLSFPSGHASIVSASAAYVVMSNQYAASKASFYLHTDRFISVFAVVMALVISVTRVTDYWHRTVDVMVGALVGISCSLFWWYVTVDQIKKQVQTYGSVVSDSEASSDSLKSPFLRYESVEVTDSGDQENGDVENSRRGTATTNNSVFGAI